MAITKMERFDTNKFKRLNKTSQGKADYIINPKKTTNTDENIFKFCFGCNETTVDNDFEMVREKAKMLKGNYEKIGGKNILVWEIYQSFSPEENVSKELVFKIGKELAERFLGNKYQYILGTHDDRGHLHNHILFNATSFVDFKKFNTKKYKEYQRLREISNDICKKYGLSITPYEHKKWKEKETKKETNTNKNYDKEVSYKNILEEDIKEILPYCIDFNNFIERMKKLCYEVVEVDNDIKFKQSFQKNYTSLSTLNEDFCTKEKIEEILKNKTSIKKIFQKTPQRKEAVRATSALELKDPKIIITEKGISWRAKLKYCIDYYIYKSSNFNEFLQGMQNAGYKIKYGKHIAFKCAGMDKNIRAKYFGEDYTEEKIKERILEEIKPLPQIPVNKTSKEKKYFKKSFKEVAVTYKEKIEITKELDIKNIISIENNKKYQEQINYQKFVRKHNTKQLIKTDNFMRRNKYTEDTLNEAIAEIESKIFEDKNKLSNLEKEFKKLNNIKKTEENKKEIEKAYEKLNELKIMLETRLNDNKKAFVEHTIVKDNLKNFEKNRELERKWTL